MREQAHQHRKLHERQHADETPRSLHRRKILDAHDPAELDETNHANELERGTLVEAPSSPATLAVPDDRERRDQVEQHP